MVGPSAAPGPTTAGRRWRPRGGRGTAGGTRWPTAAAASRPTRGAGRVAAAHGPERPRPDGDGAVVAVDPPGLRLGASRRPPPQQRGDRGRDGPAAVGRTGGGDDPSPRRRRRTGDGRGPRGHSQSQLLAGAVPR